MTMALSKSEPLVLSVNAGSSSLKFGLYPEDGPALWTGCYEGLQPGGQLSLRSQGLCQVLPALPEGGSRFDAAMAHLLQNLADSQAGEPRAVVHRIVHGGERYAGPVLLGEPVLAYLHSLNPLAPLHQPHNLAGVAACTRLLPGMPQVACFDTAFHANLPPVEQTLPIARALAAQGLRRYGFHGLSYQYLSQELARWTPRARGRALLAHLGNGASVCATLSGRSMATSMGFSALDGLMMGTRSGQLDPGVLLHLLRQGWDLPRLETLLYRQSGLLGVSGLSADMRALRASGRSEAQEAIELFTHRVKREMGAQLALLQGVDLIAFTGGIGEHDAKLRADVCEALAFAGVQLSAVANAAAQGEEVLAIHAPESRVEVWVVPTDEGRVAAQSAFALLREPALA